MKYTKICKTCKTQFNTYSKTQIFCSNKCYSLNRTTLKNIECKYCKKIFKPKNKKAKFCSKECSHKGTSNTKFSICATCGKSMYVIESRIGRQKFCSGDCYHKYNLMKNDSKGYSMVYCNKRKKNIRTHIKLVLDYLNLDNIPKGYNIHHRDCNKNNNILENLVLLNTAEHAKLHNALGNIGLNLVTLNNSDISKKLFELCNKELQDLIELTVIKQKELHIF